MCIIFISAAKLYRTKSSYTILSQFPIFRNNGFPSGIPKLLPQHIKQKLHISPNTTSVFPISFPFFLVWQNKKMGKQIQFEHISEIQYIWCIFMLV